MTNVKTYRLPDYIGEFYESKADFARKQNELPQTITKWVNAGYFVIIDGDRHIMCKELRELNRQIKSGLND